jgi:hypothetical protein
MFAGFLNRTLALADCPGERVATFGTVTNGHPPKLPTEFARVAPAVNESRTIWKGPVSVLLLTFVIVTVPLNVAVARLYDKPDAVTAIWLPSNNVDDDEGGVIVDPLIAVTPMLFGY